MVIFIFGSFRQKIDFDLVLRSQHAFALLKAADHAVRHGKKKVTVIEFGVAGGNGIVFLEKYQK